MHTVIETPAYLSRVKITGATEDECAGIIEMLRNDPTRGDLVVGTGGARKVRYAREGGGKSGGYRVITYFGGHDVPLFLLDIFGKGDQANLSQADRNALAKVLPKIAEAYRKSSKAAAAATERKGKGR